MQFLFCGWRHVAHNEPYGLWPIIGGIACLIQVTQHGGSCYFFNLFIFPTFLLSRDAMLARYMLWPCVCLSVCPSVTSRSSIDRNGQTYRHANNAARQRRDSSFLVAKILLKFHGGKYTWMRRNCNFRKRYNTGTEFLWKLSRNPYALHRTNGTLPMTFSDPSQYNFHRLPQFFYIFGLIS